jgi:hypothetical protein
LQAWWSGGPGIALLDRPRLELGQTGGKRRQRVADDLADEWHQTLGEGRDRGVIHYAASR